jgi:putative toxin-antitoxin system antitoxin component (TIGR02293 family)
MTPFDLAELADTLDEAVGRHAQRNASRRFSRSEISRLLRIEKVLGRAQRLFGDRRRALQWLTHRNRALQFESPLFHLETNAGAERVMALLSRIDDGAFA